MREVVIKKAKECAQRVDSEQNTDDLQQYRSQRLQGIHLMDCTMGYTWSSQTSHQINAHLAAELGVAGGRETGDPGATSDEDGWDTGGAVWPADVGTGTAAGGLTGDGVARL